MERERRREGGGGIERKQEGEKESSRRKKKKERLRNGRPYPQNALIAVAIHLSASSPSLLLLYRDGSTVKKIGQSLSGHSSGGEIIKRQPSCE